MFIENRTTIICDRSHDICDRLHCVKIQIQKLLQSENLICNRSHNKLQSIARKVPTNIFLNCNGHKNPTDTNDVIDRMNSDDRSQDTKQF